MKKFLILFLLILLGFCGLGIALYFQLHWFAVHTGTVNESGPYYGFWSGFGSDLGEITLISAVLASAVTFYRAHECHNSTCHWPASHTTANGHRLCKKCITKPNADLDLHEVHEDHTTTTAEKDTAAARERPVKKAVPVKKAAKRG